MPFIKEKIVKPIYFLAVEGLANLSAIKLGSGSSRHTPSSCLILPSADAGNPGSLGDDAMVSSIVQQLKASGIEKIDFFKYYKNSPKYLDTAEEMMLPSSLIALIFELPALRKVIARYDIFICVGADVLDGYYSEDRSLRRLFLSDFAAKIGLKSIITGFSYKEGASPLVAKKFRSLHRSVWLCCRDAVSLGRLHKSIGIRSARLVADVAFLLIPDYQSQKSLETTKWIKQQRTTGNLVIGVNVNPHILAKFSTKEEKQTFLAKFRSSLENLHKFKEGKVSFLGIPHDSRPFGGSPSDIELVKDIFSELPTQVKANSMVMEMPFRAADVKAVCKDLSLVFTGRMHLAIASLGQGVPVLCLTYQDKFAGLFQHFKMAPLTISPSSTLEGELISRTLEETVNNLDDYKAQVQKVLPSVKDMAYANLDSLLSDS